LVQENLFCAGTYKKILDIIAKPALENADLKLSTKVIRIETGSNNVKVFTKDGDEFGFDEVVMTAPLGWLKQHKDAFVPPLPPRLLQAIDSIGYGSLEKVSISHTYFHKLKALTRCRFTSRFLAPSGSAMPKTQTRSRSPDLPSGSLRRTLQSPTQSGGIKKSSTCLRSPDHVLNPPSSFTSSAINPEPWLEKPQHYPQ
jgi:hypothetical protein